MATFLPVGYGYPGNTHKLANGELARIGSDISMSKNPSLSKQFQTQTTLEKRKTTKAVVDPHSDASEDEQVLMPNVYVTPTIEPTISLAPTPNTVLNSSTEVPPTEGPSEPTVNIAPLTTSEENKRSKYKKPAPIDIVEALSREPGMDIFKHVRRTDKTGHSHVECNYCHKHIAFQLGNVSTGNVWKHPCLSTFQDKNQKRLDRERNETRSQGSTPKRGERLYHQIADQSDL
jgi:hypothetical protein